MKTSAFYRRAFEDAAFRREKLGELRFIKWVHSGTFSSCLLFGIALSLITRQWSEQLALFGAALLSAAAYSDCSNRLAALEAFEKTPGSMRGPDAGNVWQG
jgi:hypothetical protein